MTHLSKIKIVANSVGIYGNFANGKPVKRLDGHKELVHTFKIFNFFVLIFKIVGLQINSNAFRCKIIQITPFALDGYRCLNKCGEFNLYADKLLAINQNENVKYENVHAPCETGFTFKLFAS